MKKTFLSTLRGFAACVMAVFVSVAFSACSSDDDEPVIPAPQTFTGQLSTSIPSMLTFEPIVGENSAVVTWANPEQTLATVKLGAFSIAVKTPMGEHSYNIGEMTISDVPCVKSGNKITMSKPEFECQAGDFKTTGSLEGTLENGTFTLTLLYTPGTMPLKVKTVLVGK
ncbi:hypothetical protein E5358_06650 [Palleniella muris]|uniref:Uncharacterized protein n=1 Tax=Palleniella muris TaxID=3038145 RepID=A0AC61QQH5_9BACT|nr:calycin-like domain-containing protein [Palleniella muris]TGX82445.1 hypothetical protein E5358_06650 [Palleniella muris]